MLPVLEQADVLAVAHRDGRADVESGGVLVNAGSPFLPMRM